MTDLSSYALSPVILDELRKLVPEGSTVLEIGTGDGTAQIAEHYNVISIEDNPEYHTGHSELLHVPLVRTQELDLPNAFHKRFPKANWWYDTDILAEKLEGISYDVIIIDGPGGGRERASMWWFYHKMFDISVPVIIDDVYRQYDWAVTYNIGRFKGCKPIRVVYGKSDGSDDMLAIIE